MNHRNFLPVNHPLIYRHLLAPKISFYLGCGFIAELQLLIHNEQAMRTNYRMCTQMQSEDRMTIANLLQRAASTVSQEITRFCEHAVFATGTYFCPKAPLKARTMGLVMKVSTLRWPVMMSREAVMPALTSMACMRPLGVMAPIWTLAR
jgi:hypothetical protein